jgi:pyruvate carboxylase
MSQPAYDDSIDPASIAENAQEEGIEHYSYLKLGKYNLTATWHATLYQVWEQQSRRFLFQEMSRFYDIQLEKFCTKVPEIKKAFKLHNVDIESFSCWTQIRELNLLCNVIKHGDGGSAKSLRKIKPELFKQEDNIDYMKTFKTTLLEETLNINEMTLRNYRKALLSFWDEIPERNYSDEL